MGLVQYRIARLEKKYQILTGTVLTLGTIESATGGAISDRITNVPGSSQFYKGSIISYSNAIKTHVAGVNQSTLTQYGAVSYETGKEMAFAGRKLLEVDVCVADTGIAGPQGAAPKKPVGLFFIAMSCSDGTEICREYHFSGDRITNKKNAACAALEMIADYLDTKIKRLLEADFPEKRVVTSFILKDGKVLILRRSQKVGTYQGRWSAVSGYLETKPLKQAFKEIEEETGLSPENVTLIKKGLPLNIIDESLKTIWKIYPFAFILNHPRAIKTDWENVEHRWVSPEEIDNLPAVPGLKQAMTKVIKYS